MNIAFYVSGKATRLKKILESNFQDLFNNTKLIISDSSENRDLLSKLLEDKEIRLICKPYESLKPIKGSKSLALSRLLLEKFKLQEIDYCFCFGDNLLKGDLLDTYKDRIINFHPSLLPAFKGRLSIDKALEEGATLLGNTAHFITKEVDSGPIIMQSTVHVSRFEENGYDAVMDAQIKMLKQIYEWLKDERIIVEDSKVRIKDADYGEVNFYPELEI